MIDARGEQDFQELGIDHKKMTFWRGRSLDSRLVWKAVCATLNVLYSAWYASLVSDSAVMLIIGAIWLVKIQCEIWGQHTPTWACPGGWGVFVAMYVLGMPAFLWMYGTCRVPDIVGVPQRELVGVAFYLFGSCYSLFQLDAEVIIIPGPRHPLYLSE